MFMAFQSSNELSKNIKHRNFNNSRKGYLSVLLQQLQWPFMKFFLSDSHIIQIVFQTNENHPNYQPRNHQKKNKNKENQPKSPQASCVSWFLNDPTEEEKEKIAPSQNTKKKNNALRVWMKLKFKREDSLLSWETHKYFPLPTLIRIHAMGNKRNGKIARQQCIKNS